MVNGIRHRKMLNDFFFSKTNDLTNGFNKVEPHVTQYVKHTLHFKPYFLVMLS